MRYPAPGILLLGALVATGCSIAPPPPLEVDCAQLGSDFPAEEGWVPATAPSLAMAPVAKSYVTPRDAVFQPDATAAVASTAAPRAPGAEATTAEAKPPTPADAEEVSPYCWATPPLDERAMQVRFAGLLGWSLYAKGRDVPQIDPGRVTKVDDATREEDPQKAERIRRELRERSLCIAADDLRADLVFHLDVTKNRTSWKSRDGLLWWLNLALFWGGGVLPVAFVPDEVYESSISARVTIVHARTGERLFQKEYSASHEESLNEPERGWSLSGRLGLHPYFLDADSGDYEKAHDGLEPHAMKKLEQAILSDLRASLPKTLKVPAHRVLLRDGTPSTARTYAVVVGHNGPKGSDPELGEGYVRLRRAENDARAIGALLRETGTVHSDDHIRVLVDDDATPEKILAAVAELAPRVLGHDTLVFYFAGYGQTDAAGAPGLILGTRSTTLPLAQLEQACRKPFENRTGLAPRVLFLLDTSFGPTARGRSFRFGKAAGGPALDPATYLAPLGNRALNWCVLAAAGPSEAAFEIDAADEASRHGYFTRRILTALGTGDADRKPRDGVVSTKELFDYLVERVPEEVRPAEGAEQTPERRGTQDEQFVVGRVKAAGGTSGGRGK